MASERSKALMIGMIGSSSSGAKTSLAFRFAHGEFSENTIATIGADYFRKNLELDGMNVPITLIGLFLQCPEHQLFFSSRIRSPSFFVVFVVDHCSFVRLFSDCCGQESKKSLILASIKDAGIIIVGFDVANRRSFEDCTNWLILAEQSKTTGVVRVTIGVGNKIDLVDERKISTEEARTFFEGMSIPYYETSARTGEGVQKMFEESVRLWLKKNTDRNSNPEINQRKAENKGKCIVC